MLQNKLHHTKFPVLRRCYVQLFTARELTIRAATSQLSEEAREKLRAARVKSNYDKHFLRKLTASDKLLVQQSGNLKTINNIRITLDEVNTALDRLLRLSPERAHALIDKWEYKARQR